MSKKNKKPLVPRYRFPEFQNAGEWECMPLSELLTETKTRNRDLKFNKEQVLSVSGEYGCVNQIEFLGRSYAGVSVKNYHVVEKGDIVYTKSPLKLNPFGIIKENKGKPGIVSTLYAVYRITEKGNSTYLDHYFSNDYNLNSYLQPIVRKGAKNDMKVNNYAVLSGELIVPKPPEQQKIADCLTSLDELITAETDKLEAYKAHKNGLMQKLFPAEGKTVPEWRFPEFLGKGEWIEKKLGNIGEPLMCKRVLKEQTTNEVNNGIPFYKIGTFGKKADSFISLKLYNELKNKYSFPQKGDILISASGTIGRLVIYDGSPSYFQDSNIVWLDNDENMILNKFLFYCYSTVNWQTSDGGIIQRLYNSDLKNIQVVFPKEKEEQEIITNCFSSLDKLIIVQSQKIEALKSHKKGLMQGLFLSADEVRE